MRAFSTGSVLAPLEVVPGVVGSFVLDPSGKLAEESLSPAFDDADWSSIAGSLHRLQDALATLGSDVHQCVLSFAEQKLVLRKSAHGLVCVIVEDQANMPALQMATNLVVRAMDVRGGLV